MMLALTINQKIVGSLRERLVVKRAILENLDNRDDHCGGWRLVRSFPLRSKRFSFSVMEGSTAIAQHLELGVVTTGMTGLRGREPHPWTTASAHPPTRTPRTQKHTVRSGIFVARSSKKSCSIMVVFLRQA
jgi:hypothetical protein